MKKQKLKWQPFQHQKGVFAETPWGYYSIGESTYPGKFVAYWDRNGRYTEELLGLFDSIKEAKDFCNDRAKPYFSMARSLGKV